MNIKECKKINNHNKLQRKSENDKECQKITNNDKE